MVYSIRVTEDISLSLLSSRVISPIEEDWAAIAPVVQLKLQLGIFGDEIE